MAMADRSTSPAKGDTKQRILQLATELIRARGFHGFTFHDVAAELGTSHVAVHHHYKTKALLVDAAVRAYTERFVAELDAIAGSEASAAQQLRRYAKLFETAGDDDDRICLCGALAAEIATLPEPVPASVREFFQQNEAWLAKVLAKQVGGRPTSARIQQLARSFLALLEGAMLGARAFGDRSRIQSAAQLWLDALPTG